ncbi:uncharacterized protein LOC123542113 [Mercenaria mercenaria]|uniref:uncharacterized protein LOC123542113 n=1 Tax=Mercenaria mercenaria TaxID=6596 RepID=UPI00234F42D6|nr:uncharacterized protein LOC123542113 [Mercenaria mercenaria]
MATSNNPDGQVAEKISETSAFAEKTKSKLEEMFGRLYLHGQLGDMDATERQELMGLREKLEDLKNTIDHFQKDSSEVCGIDSSVSKQRSEVERRDVKGRLCVDRDPESGYKSKELSKAYSTPSQSFDRLAGADKNDTNVTSDEETELYNPSVPLISSSDTNECQTERKEVTSFFLETPEASTTSLCKMDDEPDQQPTNISKLNAEQESATNPSDVQFVPDVLNDLSKPPSEENNLAYPTEPSPTTNHH